VTADGYEVFTDVHASTVSVAVNVKTSPTGTDPTLQFRIDQLDPADDVTPIGEPVEGGELDAQGNEILTLQIPGTSTVKVSWTVGGIAPSFGSVGATLVGKGSPASTAVNAEGVLEIVGTVPEGGVYNGFPLVTAGLDNAGLVHAIYADSSGRLTVNTIAPAPAGAIEVQVNAEGSVTGSSFLDTFYTITDGYALTLTRMGGSSQKAGKASQVVLFEDPNGDLSVLNTINIPIILMAKSQSEALVSEFTGDGTRRVVLRRERLDGNPTTMTAFFSGFEQEL
jgi:hypothetical protein